MSGSPSWLTTSAPAPAPAAAAPEPLSIEPTTQAAGTATETSDEDDLPRIILMMRLLNMGAATGLITISVGAKRFETRVLEECRVGRRIEDNKNSIWSAASQLAYTNFIVGPIINQRFYDIVFLCYWFRFTHHLVSLAYFFLHFLLIQHRNSKTLPDPHNC